MLVLLVSSCKDEVDNRVLENKKEVQKQEVILKNIQKIGILRHPLTGSF
jgi:hypothetical protein